MGTVFFTTIHSNKLKSKITEKFCWLLGVEAQSWSLNVPNVTVNHESVYSFQSLFVQRNKEKVAKAFFFSIGVKL